MVRRYGWKQVHADGRTRNNFVWPLVVGAEVSSSDDVHPGNTTACPKRPGDGLSVGLTARGVARGGVRSQTVLVVSWDDADTAGEDADKVRVLGPVRVEAVLDRDRVLRQHGAGANLADANLADANLADANLADANLADANLMDANLRCAYLTRADLTRGDLTGADLTGADLSFANLVSTDLTGADLTDANLARANLDGANLTGAYLAGAYLAGAYLADANLGRWERGPDGYARRKAT